MRDNLLKLFSSNLGFPKFKFNWVKSLKPYRFDETVLFFSLFPLVAPVSNSGGREGMAKCCRFGWIDALMERDTWLRISVHWLSTALPAEQNICLKHSSITYISTDVPFIRSPVHIQLALSWLIMRLQENGTNHHFGTFTCL